MRKSARYEYDNRDAGQMYEYMEARIEALKRHIRQLEQENEALRNEGAHSNSRHNVAV